MAQLPIGSASLEVITCICTWMRVAKRSIAEPLTRVSYDENKVFC